jgi:hypothetical protein
MLKSVFRKITVYLFSACFLSVVMLQPVSAAIISTQTALASEQRAGEVARIQQFLDRDDVQAQLIEMGVEPAAAQERVAALTDAELARIAQHLDQLPAGGSVIAVVGIVFVVLLILELVGVTNIFTNF